MLNRSGTGDDFMSARFQQTLRDSPLTVDAEGEITSFRMAGVLLLIADRLREDRDSIF